MKRSLGQVLMVLLVVVASSLVFADDLAQKGESEQFPQSAKLIRDRRADAVLETARSQLRQKDYAAAIVALQELLDGPNAFVGGGAHVSTFVEEAGRLLREMPPAGRDAYERIHGPEANRLWLESRQTGHVDLMREVVARFGTTNAGWFALRDLVARHLDRSEWALAAAASRKLATHPHSNVTRETGWVTRWVLAESHLPGRSQEAREVLLRFRKQLEGSKPLTDATDGNQFAWLERRLLTSNDNQSVLVDDRTVLSLAPSGHNVFQNSAPLDGEPARWQQEILTEWEQYDIPALPSVQPLLVGELLIARFVHPAKVIAVDTRRGKLLWDQSLSGSLGSTASDLQRHPGIRTPLVEELQRRWFGDSVRGRMTSDGRRLFLVRDLDDLDLKPGAGSRLRNHLEAWDVKTGERIWRVGSSVNEPPTGFEGLYFLGPPLASDGWLFVIAQRELQVALWALRASDGKLEWMLPLAETDRQQFKDPGWRHVACPVAWAGGRLICPTGAGCIVAVDPITRSLAWSFRFERDENTSVSGFLAADRERPFASRWWESWREIESRELRVERREQGVSVNRLLIASPESKSLRAVDAHSGELLWRTPFDEPLFMATNESAILVFERDHVSGIDPLDGRKRWQTTHSVPDGTGDWIGTRYVCPTLGGWSLIDSETGHAQQSENGFWWDLEDVSKKDQPAEFRLPSTGRLVRVGSRWAALFSHRLGLFDSFATRQAVSREQLRSKPDDLTARMELAEIVRQLGKLDQAEELLRPMLNDSETAAKASGPMRELMLRRLRDNPADHLRLSDELLRLSAGDIALGETRRALIEAARSAGDSVTALRIALELLDMTSERDKIVGHAFNRSDPQLVLSTSHVEGTLRVRQDRWAQGLVEDLFSQADEATRLQLDRVLAERQQRATENPDAFALQDLSEQLGCLPLGRELRMQLSGRTSRGVGYLKTSLALREIARGSNRVAAAQAWYRLALLHDFRSEPLDAADCYRQLRDHFADVKQPDGRGSAEWLADVPPDSQIGRRLAKGPQDSWPNRMPKVTSQDELHDDIYCYLTPVESRDSFWARTTVSVERQGKKVRFTGGDQRGFWELPLPTTNSPFRHDFSSHRGWGLGPLLVLQIGESLFGIQPLDERGETNAKLLWAVSAGPYDETGAHQMLPAKLGVRLDTFRHLDRYEQPILDVVHASAGLLCYRTRNRLIAIDPATGEWLWSRHQLPPTVSITGDGERIVIRILATREIEVRRGFDGKLLSQRHDESDPNTIVFEQGRLRLTSIANQNVGNPETILSCQDVVTGETLWQHKHPADSVVLKMDDLRIGLVEPLGTLRFLGLSDGRELANRDVAVPKALSTAHAFWDDQRLFVILSAPVTELSWLNTQQDRGSYRRPLLNGWLLVFERESLKFLWTIPARNLPFNVDQPHDTPFLVLPYKRPSDDSVDGQHSDGVLHLIDKRTGKEVLYDVGGLINVYATLEPDPLQERIDLLVAKRRIRLDYAED